MISAQRHRAGSSFVAVLFCGLIGACGFTTPSDDGNDGDRDARGDNDGDGDSTQTSDQDCGSGTCTDETSPNTPAIVRVTSNVRGSFYGSALLFVVARGDDLTYTWRKVGNPQVVNDGPEPFFLIGDLTEDDHGDCYVVTVSDDIGNAVSDPMCLTVGEVGYDFNADGGPIEADVDVGQLFGNLLLALVRLSTAGPTAPLESFWSELGPQPATSCGDLETTLDGVVVAQSDPTPLGEHRLSRTWTNCGGILLGYDFPDELGVGTMTIHFSGLAGLSQGRINGSMQVIVTRDATGAASYDDQVIMELRDELSVGNEGGVYKSDVDGYRLLSMQRSGTIMTSAHFVTTAEVDFANAAMSFYDAGGFTQVFATGLPGILTFGGNGTASGNLAIWSSELGPPDEEVLHCGLIPSGDGVEWELFVD